MPNCETCTEKCPQAEMANEIAKGRMYATQEFIRVQKELERYKQAEAEGRLLVLETAQRDSYKGLKRKYIVFKSDSGEPVENCFVLRPDKDHAAKIALEAYAKTTDNKTLADDITRWIGDSGKVLVPPCKVGDELWFEQNGQLRCETVDRVTVDKTDEDDEWYISIYTMSVSVLAEDVGRIVFLTRAAAEAALTKEAMANGY